MINKKFWRKREQKLEQSKLLPRAKSIISDKFITKKIQEAVPNVEITVTKIFKKIDKGTVMQVM